MDCWDGVDGEPIITHGWAWTTSLTFKDVLECGIKPYAFEVSDYPLVLSLENHCSKDQQAKMAHYLKDIFGDMLYQNPVDKSLESLPSPENLKNKILIKDKKIKFNDKSGEIIEESKDEEDFIEIPKYLYQRSNEMLDEPDGAGSDEVKEIIYKLTKSQELSDLVNYVEAIKFKGFDKKREFWQMSSFAETKAFSLLENQETEFLQFNQSNISRIYPGGTRVDSSNFYPQKLWSAGCHMVALNFQTVSIVIVTSLFMIVDLFC